LKNRKAKSSDFLRTDDERQGRGGVYISDARTHYASPRNDDDRADTESDRGEDTDDERAVLAEGGYQDDDNDDVQKECVI